MLKFDFFTRHAGIEQSQQCSQRIFSARNSEGVNLVAFEVQDFSSLTNRVDSVMLIRLISLKVHMPDFLPQGTYADAGKRFFEHYLEYTALTTELERAEGRTEYCRYEDRRSLLAWEMLHDFSADPLHDPNLCRGNWTLAAKRPRLELTIGFGSRQKLIMSAQPHSDTVDYVSGIAWMLRRRSTDFKVFQDPETNSLDAFLTNVLELSTEGMSYLNGLSHWGYRVDRESAPVSVLQRMMVASLLRHKIYQLSLSFDCVLRTPFRNVSINLKHLG